MILAGCAGAIGSHAQPRVYLDKCSDGGFMGVDLAIEYCTRAIKSGALSPRELALAHANRSTGMLHKNQHDLALADLDESIRHFTENASPFITRGWLRARKNDLDGALADYDNAVRLDPERAEAFLQRGGLWLRRNDPDRAIADFTQALKFQLVNQNQYLGAGSSYARRRANYDRTRHDSLAFYGRGVAYSRKQDYARAIADLSDSIRLDPESLSAFEQRAETFLRSKEYERAAEDFKEIRRLTPR